VVLNDDEWVDIKSQMTVADWDTLQKSLVSIDVTRELESGLTRAERNRLRRFKQPDSQAPEVSAKFQPSVAILLHINIVAWSFTDEAGDPVPVSRETIDRMDPGLARDLQDVIDERNPTVTATSALKSTATS